MARVRAQLRRITSADTQGALVSFGQIAVDLTARLVTRHGETLHLTPIEYRLLVFLITHSGRVVTYQQLLKGVWGPGHLENSHYVRVHMANLRKKIEENPSMPRHIVTESGIGYRFVLSGSS